jgi:hypothetical protein
MSDDPPDVGAWTKEIMKAHRKAGFDHGWLPAGRARLSTIDYTKAPH